MHLFFDTETTGLPKDWKAPSSATNNWPRMVQIAWVLADDEGTILETYSAIIRPEGFTIPRAASDIHRVTQERALEEGLPLEEVLAAFTATSAKAKQLVAHNMAFDEMILGCEFYRSTGKDPLKRKPKACTMKNDDIIEWAAIPPFRYGSYKWPTLEQLHRKLFKAGVPDAHDALVDVEATVRCYFGLRAQGVI
ncbi:3'-5' exonuclease [Neolewinella aurantiaca]|uniref:3'-5' exonuclease n=1 Tax=Neolewinella aurantiaca TaxID=2602767 RepID=A0A5C7FFK9_9BACT|nr:3'-5' exonuclease [Neolewinella aurantiaca]TXF84725.1 3'-5' exonuclease [Neolewinella aurantiaca]